MTAARPQSAIGDAGTRSPGSVLRRPRLEERLDEAFGKRLTLVVASAGYGKSTLVATWASDVDCAWVTATPQTAALSPFFRSLVGALSTRVPDFPPELAFAVGPLDACASHHHNVTMAKAKTTVYLDEDVLRRTRVAAARQGKRDSEIVEEALRSYLIGSVLESIWAHQREQGLELSEEEALELAYSELRAAREERDRSSAA